MTEAAEYKSIQEVPAIILEQCYKFLIREYARKEMQKAFPGDDAGMASPSVHERTSASHTYVESPDQWGTYFNGLTPEQQLAEVNRANATLRPWVAAFKRE